MKQDIKNCAIYCRKSTEEGLDMDFNTLDAQREACEAYISSQKSEGWKAIKTKYQDGGFSGGNLDRPAMHALLADIKEGKVQTVVVYKIDRLTRSLMDFAKLVEVFDKYGVTFVSVTQSFNTTTSMGRLTLNVLLSFAQFEREVSAERIRDKIAASKKKGIWMGGIPPIGYEAIDKKLVININNSKLIQYIFEWYLRHGTVAKLKQDLDENKIISPLRISKRGKEMGGKPFSRGNLYELLKNPVYIGKVRHKDQIYDGNHEGIISEELWSAVQKRLISQTGAARGHKKALDQNLLKGLLFDVDGTPYSPDFTNKKGKKYRYYLSQNLIQYRDHPKGTMARIPAHEIEQVVCSTLHKKLFEALNLDDVVDHEMMTYLNKNTVPSETLVRNCIIKIVVHTEELELEINPENLRQVLQDKLGVSIPVKFENPVHVIRAPFTTRRSYKGALIIKPDNQDYDPLDLAPYQLRNLVRGNVWREEHFSGTTLDDIAGREKCSKQYIQKIILKSMNIA